jgi:N-acylneuraminate cytidylyltransferase
VGFYLGKKLDINVAIIPARAGSKRIPLKNARNFCGKPMIAWSIEAAIKCGLFDQILVSTDSDEIGSIASQFGAGVPFIRPAELSGDFVHISPVVAHAVEWLKSNRMNPNYVCCIYATAPFVTATDLMTGYEKITGGKCEKVIAATTLPYPFQRAFFLGEDSSPQMFFPEEFPKRSQDLPVAWHDAGQFYWASPETWLQKAKPYGSETKIVKIPRWRALDIDTMEDWEMAEAMFRGVFSRL